MPSTPLACSARRWGAVRGSAPLRGYLAEEQACRLIERLNTSTLVGLRDHALIADPRQCQKTHNMDLWKSTGLRGYSGMPSANDSKALCISPMLAST